MADVTERGFKHSAIIQQKQEEKVALERQAEAEWENKMKEWLAKRMEEMLAWIAYSQMEPLKGIIEEIRIWRRRSKKRYELLVNTAYTTKMRLAPSEIIELCHGKIDSLESQMECQWLESQELFLKIEEIRVRIEIPLNAAQDNLYHKLLRDQFIKSEFYNLKLQELREEWIVELMDIVQGPFDEHLEEANEQPFDKHLEELNQQPFDEHLEEVNQLTSKYHTPGLLPELLDPQTAQVHLPFLGQVYSYQFQDLSGSSQRENQGIMSTVEGTKDQGNYQLQNPDQPPNLSKHLKLSPKPNPEEGRLEGPDLNFDQAEINTESRLKAQDVSNLQVPPSGNRYLNNFWMDYRPLKLFRKVFYEEWDYEEHHIYYQLLQELPGGGTSNVEFIHILTDIGTEAFLKDGDWNSTYGHIGYKIRLSLYNEDKKGLRWAQKNIPAVKRRKFSDSFQEEGNSIC
jgi:hypothetical protein